MLLKTMTSLEVFPDSVCFSKLIVLQIVADKFKLIICKFFLYYGCFSLWIILETNNVFYTDDVINLLTIFLLA